jgi:phosphate transport system substrate-binding protein
LTLSELKQIYIGNIVNWKQVGGPDLSITPYRNLDSDQFFIEKILENQAFSAHVELIPTTTQALRELARTPGGIYYTSAPLVVAQCSVKPLPLGRSKLNEFVPPYQEPFVPASRCPSQRNQLNISAFQRGEYPLIRSLFVVVKQNGGLEEQVGEAYANLLLTDEGQALLAKAGFVGVR